MSTSDRIAAFYSDPANPASFSGINKLTKHTHFSQQELKEGLKSLETHTVHSPLKLNYPTRKIYAKRVNYLFEADLCDLSRFKEHNDNTTFLMGAIDVLSKRAFVIPIFSKHHSEMIRAFTQIFNRAIPEKIRTDKGAEFMSRPFQTFLRRHNVHHYVSHGYMKCAVIERFWRTLKGRIMKYLHRNNTFRYIDVLPQIIQSYNKTYHSSIKMSPLDVNSANQEEVWRRLYGTGPKRPLKPAKFSVGEQVRLASLRYQFYKGYYPKFSHEIFFIHEIHNNQHPIMYTIRDMNGELIEGRFYEEEMVSVKEDIENKLYPIDKIISRRGRKVLVSFRYYPQKFNRWMNINELQRI